LVFDDERALLARAAAARHVRACRRALVCGSLTGPTHWQTSSNRNGDPASTSSMRTWGSPDAGVVLDVDDFAVARGCLVDAEGAGF
jgi:hypothetical protein